MFHGPTSISGSGLIFNNFEKGNIDLNKDSHYFKLLVKHVSPKILPDSREVSSAPRCRRGTRVAILDDIYHWAAGSEYTIRIQWIYGSAGSGKSTLLRTLAKMFQQHDLLLASCFFLDAEDRNDSDYFIPTIAYQISRSIPIIRSHIESAIRNDPLIFGQSLEAQARTLIVKPIIQGYQDGCSSDQYQRIIIVDGLDQCKGEREQQDVLRALNTILEEAPIPLAFLIASRLEPHILAIFDSELRRSSIKQELKSLSEANEDIRNNEKFCEKCGRHTVRSQSPVAHASPPGTMDPMEGVPPRSIKHAASPITPSPSRSHSMDAENSNSPPQGGYTAQEKEETHLQPLPTAPSEHPDCPPPRANPTPEANLQPRTADPSEPPAEVLDGRGEADGNKSCSPSRHSLFNNEYASTTNATSWHSPSPASPAEGVMNVVLGGSTQEGGEERAIEVENTASGIGGELFPVLTCESPSLKGPLPVVQGVISPPMKPGPMDSKLTKFGYWLKSKGNLRAERTDVDRITSDDVVIGVMGPTGSGKSSFISFVSGLDIGIGYSFKSYTAEVSMVRFSSPALTDSDIVLVETPGFDNTDKSDVEILTMISDWLGTAYKERISLAGLLYFHCISYNRMAGTPLKNFKIFQELCGKSMMKNVIFVTTMWDEVDDETGRSREAQLLDSYWKSSIEQGSRTRRYLLNAESAFLILEPLVAAANIRKAEALKAELEKSKPALAARGSRPKGIPKGQMRIQKEMHNYDLELQATSAGQALYEELGSFVARREEFLNRMREQMSQLENIERDTYRGKALSKELEDLQKNLEDTYGEMEKLKLPLGDRLAKIMRTTISMTQFTGY